jgi:hypothetical protein
LPIGSIRSRTFEIMVPPRLRHGRRCNSVHLLLPLKRGTIFHVGSPDGEWPLRMFDSPPKLQRCSI